MNADFPRSAPTQHLGRGRARCVYLDAPIPNTMTLARRLANRIRRGKLDEPTAHAIIHENARRLALRAIPEIGPQARKSRWRFAQAIREYVTTWLAEALAWRPFSKSAELMARRRARLADEHRARGGVTRTVPQLQEDLSQETPSPVNRFRNDHASRPPDSDFPFPQEPAEPDEADAISELLEASGWNPLPFHVRVRLDGFAVRRRCDRFARELAGLGMTGELCANIVQWVMQAAHVRRPAALLHKILANRTAWTNYRSAKASGLRFKPRDAVAELLRKDFRPNYDSFDWNSPDIYCDEETAASLEALILRRPRPPSFGAGSDSESPATLLRGVERSSEPSDSGNRLAESGAALMLRAGLRLVPES